MVIGAAYIYTYLLFRDAVIPHVPWHNSHTIFWFTLVAVIALNFYLFSQLIQDHALRFRTLYFLFAIDLLTAGFLFFGSNEALLPMLVMLVLIDGFYVITLPASHALLVMTVTVFVFSLSMLYALGKVATDQITVELLAKLLIGLAILIGITIVLRRIRIGLDNLYAISDGLAYDLTSHAVEAELHARELQERNREVKTLMQIQEQIVSVLDFDELFKNIITAFQYRFNFDRFSLYMFDPESEKLELRYQAEDGKRTELRRQLSLGQGVEGFCFTTGEGILIKDVANEESHKELVQRGSKYRSMACQPLMFRSEQLGVLCLESHRPASFDRSAFAFLEKLAPLISLAVSNSLNYTMAKTESLTDNLTGLHNYRGFIQKFNPLLEQAYRNEYPLEILIIDIDHFKQVNDTYGHLVGNIILGELSTILQDFFRGSDLVARYGGEEFVIVLQGTPPSIAPRIAEQLRRKVEAHQFPISLQRDAFKQVTISIGVASTLDSNLDPQVVSGSRRGEEDVYLRNRDQLGEQIIENADHALYAAKNEGRNQVMLSIHYPVDLPSEPVFSIEEEY
jgi:diguanylate cyclase (GGDEF)-like protein